MKNDIEKQAEKIIEKQPTPETRCLGICHWLTAAGVEICTACGAIE